MSHTLKYLYESISNYIAEDPINASIYIKREDQLYIEEMEFIEGLGKKK